MGAHMNRISQTIKLQDGRTLGYAEYGNPEGKPIFYFHGNPGTRTEAKISELTLANQDARIISIDRPGLGLSDFKKDRTILDWPDDVVELADSLGIDKFTILGVCGGAPYVLACAYKIPKRCKSVGIIAALGPVNRITKRLEGVSKRIVFINKRVPFVFRFYFWYKMARHARSTDEKRIRKRMFLHVTKNFSPPDKKIIKKPKIIDILVERMRDVGRISTKGAVYDRKLLFRSWGFKLEEISEKVKVFLWQGDYDKTVPISVGKYMAKLIPNCQAKFFPDEGHISIVVNKMNYMAKSLTSALRE
jgi:pimeloyl-ACP methyl ester carboxylesterase